MLTSNLKKMYNVVEIGKIKGDERMAKVGVKYQDFRAAAKRIKNSGSKVEKIEDELNKAQQTAISSWTGKDAEDFNNGYKNFQKDMKKMKQVIYSIQKWMETVAQNYETEEKNAANVYKKMF